MGMMNRKAHFNEVANTWDERFFTPELTGLLKKLVPQFGLELGQNILDVGTGTGLLIPFLLQVISKSGSITAIDYAEKMVKVCRSKHSHLQNVTIELQDIEDPNLLSQSFDVITCFGLFPHLENKEKALYHMNRILKPRGKFIIAHALNSDEMKSYHCNTSSTVANDELPSKLEMERLLKHAGFVEICIKDEPGHYLCLSIKS